jgi:hypothetical protein
MVFIYEHVVWWDKGGWRLDVGGRIHEYKAAEPKIYTCWFLQSMSITPIIITIKKKLSVAGLANLRHAGRFSWHVVFTVVSFFASFARPAPLYCEQYVYIYTYLTAQSLCLNCRCYQIILRVKDFYTNREQCEVLTTGYLSLGSRPDGDWANSWHWTKRFTILFSNRKQ